MTSRSRSRTKTSNGSLKIAPSGSNPSYTNTEYSETCLDVVRDYPNEHPLTLDRTIRSVKPFEGDTKSSPTDSTYAHSFSNYWPTYPRTTAVNHLSVSGTLSDNDVGIKTVYRSNPSRPYVDLPLSIFELREVPELLHQVTKNLRARNGNPLTWTQIVAGNVLAIEYGIKPLISDIKKALDFQHQFDLKTKQLSNLYNNGGYRSKIRVGSHSSFSRISVTADSSAGIVPATVDIITAVDQWGTTRWRPDPSRSPPSTDQDMKALARRVVFGLEGPSLQTLWNAMPWTWLIDWFGNAGDYLGTFSNAVPAIHSNPCVMKYTKTTYTGKVDRSSYANLKGGDFTLTRETKSRVVMPFLLPEVRIPFLDSRQVSILGALGIQRIPRNILR